MPSKSLLVLTTLVLLALSWAVRAEDDCVQACAEIYSPVCSTTGMTYPNLCMFELDKCRLRRVMAVAYEGECFQPDAACSSSTEEVVCTANYQPICATDGRTYSNECELSKAVCNAFAPISVLHQGECVGDETCSTGCEKILKPVCASNGQSYDNACLMVSESCRTRQSLSVVHPGRCDFLSTAMTSADLYPSCASATCASDEVCVSTQKECFTTPCPQYECVKKQPATESCETVCIQNFAPVCGSDLQTYNNECEMNNQACRTKSTLSVKHQGACSKDDCDIACAQVFDPICVTIAGSSLLTVANECELQREQCLDVSKSAVAVLHRGTCTDEDANALKSNAVQTSAAAEEAECPEICTADYKPVCGLVGGQLETFTNECLLSSAACRLRTTIDVLHTGVCAQADCPEYKCTKEYKPVCALSGSELITFGNECEYQKNVCPSKFAAKALLLQHQGECTEADRAELQQSTCNQVCTTDFQPVCMNGQDYANSCEAEKVACLQKLTPNIVSGTCASLAPVCDEVCSAEYQPICGSDFHTYTNECEMNKQACRTRSSLKVQHTGTCLASECASIACTMEYNPVCASVSGSLVMTVSNPCELDRLMCQDSFAAVTPLHTGACTPEDEANVTVISEGVVSSEPSSIGSGALAAIIIAGVFVAALIVASIVIYRRKAALSGYTEIDVEKTNVRATYASF